MTQLDTDAKRPNFQTDEIDLTQLVRGLRRNLLPLLTVPLLLGAATYMLSSRQAPVYEAATRLMSSTPESGNSVVTGSAITASQLPQGAVENVVHSRQTVRRVEELLKSSGLPADIQQSIRTDLERELTLDSYKRVQVIERLDPYQRGTYEIRATGESPEAARFLASASTKALLEWDLNRAQEGVRRASQTIRQQLDNVTDRLKAAPAGSVEQQSLIAARGQLILNLSQASAFVDGARGNLTMLAEANAPSQAVAPRPTRNAVLVFLLSLFAGAGLLLILELLRRKVVTGNDLAGLGVPVLGEMPKAPLQGRRNVPAATLSGPLYEPTGFVRVNLESLLPNRPAIIAFSSARPGEGKSTLVAATASSLALTNRRVLIIDSDVHRPMQQEFWDMAGKPWVPLPGAAQGRPTTLAQALQDPAQASALDLGNGVHLLPVGEVARRNASMLSTPELPRLLKTWAANYDAVLIDTAPIFALADGLVVARHTDGLVLVVESGSTSLNDVERAARNVQAARVNLLGVVVNKVRRSEQTYYYSYSAKNV